MISRIIKLLSDLSIDIHNAIYCSSPLTRVAVTIIVVMLFVYFKTFSCVFICNKSICEVRKNNIMGTFQTTTRISVYEIDHFESEFDFGSSSVAVLSRSKHHRYNDNNKRYRINAVRKNGSKYKFFPTTAKDEFAESTVKKLNEAIKDKKNIDAKISF